MTEPTQNSSTTAKIAEIVSIGDEMTSGARLDTNTQWLSRRLEELGVEVAFHSTVGDTMEHLVDTIQIATGRADLVVATGGLGPTQDDLTRQAIAEAQGVNLELDEPSLIHIRNLFSHRGREMPPRNEIQAMLPRGAVAIKNPQGTAPGVHATFARNGVNESHFFALPGVPAEMKTMFDQSVAPEILKIGGGGQFIAQDVMKFFGVGESDMEQRLGDMISRTRQPRVGITVSAATISLRISALATSSEVCREMISQTRAEILELVADLHFGDGEDYEQHHAVVDTLRQRNQSLVTVELGHAAPLADWFSGLGRRDAYAGGLSLFEFSDLARWLSADGSNVTTPASLLSQLRQHTQADWALLVNQYPRLEADDDAPRPTKEIQFVIVGPDDQVIEQSQSLGGHPSIVQPRIAKAALMLLRQSLK